MFLAQLWWQEPCWTVWGSHTSWSSGAHQTGHWYWRTKAERYLHLEQEWYVLWLLSLGLLCYYLCLRVMSSIDSLVTCSAYSVRHTPWRSLEAWLVIWFTGFNLRTFATHSTLYAIYCLLYPWKHTHTHMLRNSDNPRAVCRATVWWPGATQWPLCASHIILHPAAMRTVLHRHDTRGWGGQEGHHQGGGNIYASFIHARVMLASL